LPPKSNTLIITNNLTNNRLSRILENYKFSIYSELGCGVLSTFLKKWSKIFLIGIKTRLNVSTMKIDISTQEGTQNLFLIILVMVAFLILFIALVSKGGSSSVDTCEEGDFDCIHTMEDEKLWRQLGR